MPLPTPGGASRASSASAAGTRGAGGAGGAALDADLDSAVETIIAANSEYQVGVALMETAGGQLHQYGVREPSQAASTAKVLTAAAYYSLVEDGPASLGDDLDDFTSGFQIRAMIQDTNNEDPIPAAVPDGVTVFHKYGLLDDELHDAAILSTSAGSYVLVVYTKGADLGDVPQRTAVIHAITVAVTAALF